MSSIFEDVKITWKGEDYTIKADRVMGLVEVVESVITIEELHGDGIKRAKISRAFCAALDYAGVKGHTQEEVYQMFFSAESMVNTVTVINAILQLMIPPESLRKAEITEEDTKKN